jgi:hypothetical protein
MAALGGSRVGHGLTFRQSTTPVRDSRRAEKALFGRYSISSRPPFFIITNTAPEIERITLATIMMVVIRYRLCKREPGNRHDSLAHNYKA